MISSAFRKRLRPRCDLWLAAWLLLGAPLLLVRLDNGVLWQDEAETGVLAKNTLRFGYPKADDGVNRVNPSLPLGPGAAWTYHPWASIYLTAAALKIRGPTTAAARLPSALLGLASIWLMARLIRRISGERSLARWAAFLMTSSVPFLLLMRQCRYYAPSLFFSLWAVWAYHRLLGCRRWAAFELAAALLVLFHVNHGVFAAVFLGLALHAAWSRPAPEIRRRLLWASVGAALLCAPFVFYLQAHQHHGAFSWRELSHHAQFYFRQINRYLFPAALWAVVLLIWRPRREQLLGARGSALREGWKLSLCLLAAGMLFLIFVPEQRHFRYLVHLIPWFLFLQAVLFVRLVQRRRWAGGLLASAILFTDLAYSGPNRLIRPEAKIRSLPLEFLGELTHPYLGPMDSVVELLSREGNPTQTVKIPYEDHTLLFYTKLRVEPIVRSEDFSRESYPDWIILRKDWLPSGFLESGYFKRIQASYDEILLDAPDIPWQNRPDPGYHRFRTDRSAAPVRVFRRSDS